MAVVQSYGALSSPAVQPRAWSGSGGGVQLYGYSQAYAAIYRDQSNVRTCVDFLSRNIAQLGYHVFRRVSDTDRVRLIDHDVVRWTEKPNPRTTRYRLFESLLADLGIYFNAYWLKVRLPDDPRGRQRIGLVRLPPDEVQVDGVLLAEAFTWTPANGGTPRVFPPSEIVYFNGYNPLDAKFGLSPLETLRRVLAEEAAAGLHREAYWRNSSRHDGVIERPATAKKWTPEQKKDFRDQWQERYTGGGAGSVAVLEDGMTFKATSWSPRDSEYTAARKLTREECAAAYHIPLPMVGILEHATFSNIKEQHKQLYADTLGPWLAMISEEIERQLLIESEDQDKVYTEFNIAAKLAGSFEEQSTALRVLVGRPIMTANEGRARLNLPQIDDPDADELAAQQGGPAAEDAAIGQQTGGDGGRAIAVGELVRASWSRQAARLGKVPSDARAEALDHARSTRELADDLEPFLGAAATAYAARVTDDTYTLLLEGAEAFGAAREVPACP